MKRFKTLTGQLVINKWINPVRTPIFGSNLLHAFRALTILATLDVLTALCLGRVKM